MRHFLLLREQCFRDSMISGSDLAHSSNGGAYVLIARLQMDDTDTGIATDTTDVSFYRSDMIRSDPVI